MTTTRHATADELAQARHYGVAAADAGRDRAPGAHRPLLTLIGDVPVGEPRTRQLMQAWEAGYSAQVDAEADALLCQPGGPHNPRGCDCGERG